MKYLKLSAFAFLVTAVGILGFTSCNGNNGEEEPTEVKVSKTTLNFTYQGGTNSFTVEGDWDGVPTEYDEWLTVTVNDNKTEVTVEAEENPGKDKRTSKISISNKTVAVTQAGNTLEYSLTPNRTKLSFFTVNAPVWEVVVSVNNVTEWEANAQQSWINVVKNNNTLTISVEDNTTSKIRLGKVLLTAEVLESPVEINVAQGGDLTFFNGDYSATTNDVFYGYEEFDDTFVGKLYTVDQAHDVYDDERYWSVHAFTNFANTAGIIETYFVRDEDGLWAVASNLSDYKHEGKYYVVPLYMVKFNDGTESSVLPDVYIPGYDSEDNIVDFEVSNEQVTGYFCWGYKMNDNSYMIVTEAYAGMKLHYTPNDSTSAGAVNSCSVTYRDVIDMKGQVLPILKDKVFPTVK